MLNTVPPWSTGDAGQQFEVLIQQRHDVGGAEALGHAREAAHVGEHHGTADAGVGGRVTRDVTGCAATGIVLSQLDQVAGRVAQEQLGDCQAARRAADAERDAAPLEFGARRGQVRITASATCGSVVSMPQWVVAAAAGGADQVDLAVRAALASGPACRCCRSRRVDHATSE